ncbi:MAG: hypothetical protein Q8M03_01110 [Legionella sp.]|nr:hypothetical protein [Legionella sp.]
MILNIVAPSGMGKSVLVHRWILFLIRRRLNVFIENGFPIIWLSLAPVDQLQFEPDDPRSFWISLLTTYGLSLGVSNKSKRSFLVPGLIQEFQTLSLRFRSVILVVDNFEKMIKHTGLQRAQYFLETLASIDTVGLIMTTTQYAVGVPSRSIRSYQSIALEGLPRNDISTLFRILSSPGSSPGDAVAQPVFAEFTSPMLVELGIKNPTALSTAETNENFLKGLQLEKVERMTLHRLAVSPSTIPESVFHYLPDGANIRRTLNALATRSLVRCVDKHYSMHPSVHSFFRKDILQFLRESRAAPTETETEALVKHEKAQIHSDWAKAMARAIDFHDPEETGDYTLVFQQLYHYCQQIAQIVDRDIINLMFDLCKKHQENWICQGYWFQTLNFFKWFIRALRFHPPDPELEFLLTRGYFEKLVFFRRLGQTLLAMESSKDAMQHMLQVVSIQRAVSESRIAELHNRLCFESGNVYLQVFQHDRACEYWSGIISKLALQNNLHIGLFSASLAQIGRAFDQLREANKEKSLLCIDYAGRFWAWTLSIKLREVRATDNQETRRYLATSVHQMGTFLLRNGDYLRARRFFIWSISLKKTLSDQRGLAMSYRKVALLHLTELRVSKKKMESATPCQLIEISDSLEQCERICLLLNDSYKLAQTHLLKAEFSLFETPGNLIAREMLDKAKELFTSTGSWFRVYQVLCLKQQFGYLSSGSTPVDQLDSIVLEDLHTFQSGKRLKEVLKWLKNCSFQSDLSLLGALPPLPTPEQLDHIEAELNLIAPSPGPSTSY